ncbi:MAG: glycogen debranching enzyme [Streblomastix strix]|uniref:Glycogen debranching enzyme n=1 Tax=Streblomastix strix TaxID=222440 RepID=A0A5J4WHQ3_9EUKA|nr:MAG: glycogen debranching enzyme [Streblomastix strix]
MSTPYIRTLTLTANGYIGHNALVRVELGTVLRIVLRAGTPAALLPLYTNCPDTRKGEKFLRTKFRRLQRANKPSAATILDWDINYDIPCYKSGAYQFYLAREPNCSPQNQPGGRFVVEPLFDIRGVATPASGLAIQTVFASCLGPIQTWLPEDPPIQTVDDPTRIVADCSLKSVIEAGYNMLHFAPINELGKSRSAYCLRNQLVLEPSVFGYDANENRINRLKKLLYRLEKEYGVLSMVDVVWNHTSTDSPWVTAHPEATYNLRNSPHLRLAYEIDRAIIALSDCIVFQNYTTAPPPIPPVLSPVSVSTSVANNNITHYSQFPPAELQNDEDIQLLNNYLKAELVHFRLWEYRVIDVEDAVTAFKQQIPRGFRNGNQQFPSIEEVDYKVSSEFIFEDGTYGRWGNKVNVRSALNYFLQFNLSAEELTNQFHNCLNRINLNRYAEYDQDIQSVVNNVSNTCKYERLDPSGPKLGRITLDVPVVWPYFSHIKTKSASKYDEEGNLQEFEKERRRLKNQNSSDSDIDPEYQVYGGVVLDDEDEDDEEEDYLLYLQSFSLQRPHLEAEGYQPQFQDLQPQFNDQEIEQYTQESDNNKLVPDELKSIHDLITKTNQSTISKLRKHLSSLRGLPAVCNGWVFGAPPTSDFAAKGSNSYCRREVVIWGDNLKLRYGQKEEDSPFLWDYMKRYTQLLASMFAGLRLDNAHSTPLPVSEFLIDSARQINPNCFTLAELFTSNEDTDVEYCARLGVTAILREAVNRGNVADLGSEIYNSGGVGIASLRPGSKELRPFKGRGLNLALSDITHDNKMPITTNRGPYSILPLAALVSSAPTPILTTKGMDEIYPDKVETNTHKIYYRLGFEQDEEDYNDGIEEKDEELGFNQEGNQKKSKMAKTSDGRYLPFFSKVKNLKNPFYLSTESINIPDKDIQTPPDQSSSVSTLQNDPSQQHINEIPLQMRHLVPSASQFLYPINYISTTSSSSSSSSSSSALQSSSSKQSIQSQNSQYSLSQLPPLSQFSPYSGILGARAVLSRLHQLLASRGYSELYVHVSAEQNAISVVRSHTLTHRAYVFIVRTVFDHNNQALNLGSAPVITNSMKQIIEKQNQKKEQEKKEQKIKEKDSNKKLDKNKSNLEDKEVKEKIEQEKTTEQKNNRNYQLLSNEEYKLLTSTQQPHPKYPELLPFGGGFIESKRQELNKTLNLKPEIQQNTQKSSENEEKAQIPQPFQWEVGGVVRHLVMLSYLAAVGEKEETEEQQLEELIEKDEILEKNKDLITKKGKIAISFSTKAKIVNENTISGVNSHLVLITSSGKTEQNRETDFQRAGIKLHPVGLTEEELNKDADKVAQSIDAFNVNPQRNTAVYFAHFPPGAVCVLATDVPDVSRQALKQLIPTLHSDVKATEIQGGNLGLGKVKKIIRKNKNFNRQKQQSGNANDEKIEDNQKKEEDQDDDDEQSEQDGTGYVDYELKPTVLHRSLFDSVPTNPQQIISSSSSSLLQLQQQQSSNQQSQQQSQYSDSLKLAALDAAQLQPPPPPGQENSQFQPNLPSLPLIPTDQALSLINKNKQQQFNLQGSSSQTQLQQYSSSNKLLEIDGCFTTAELSSAFNNLTLLDLNWLLFSSESEERDSTQGRRGAYHINELRQPLTYCGIAGVAPLLEAVANTDDLGHPLLENLRQGNWLIDYLLTRLEEEKEGESERERIKEKEDKQKELEQIEIAKRKREELDKQTKIRQNKVKKITQKKELPEVSLMWQRDVDEWNVDGQLKPDIKPEPVVFSPDQQNEKLNDSNQQGNQNGSEDKKKQKKQKILFSTSRKQRFLPLINLLNNKLAIVKDKLPRYLVPRYFDEIIRPLFRFAVSWMIEEKMNSLPLAMRGQGNLLNKSIISLNNYNNNLQYQQSISSQFIRQLCLSSIEMVAAIPHTPLLDRILGKELSFTHVSQRVGKMIIRAMRGYRKHGSESSGSLKDLSVIKDEQIKPNIITPLESIINSCKSFSNIITTNLQQQTNTQGSFSSPANRSVSPSPFNLSTSTSPMFSISQSPSANNNYNNNFTLQNEQKSPSFTPFPSPFGLQALSSTEQQGKQINNNNKDSNSKDGQLKKKSSSPGNSQSPSE